jgi:hypothetical protein
MIGTKRPKSFMIARNSQKSKRLKRMRVKRQLKGEKSTLVKWPKNTS